MANFQKEILKLLFLQNENTINSTTILPIPHLVPTPSIHRVRESCSFNQGLLAGIGPSKTAFMYLFLYTSTYAGEFNLVYFHMQKSLTQLFHMHIFLRYPLFYYVFF
jgi:hypothetical protein